MGSGVKSIFKLIIGTMVFFVLFMAIVELYNVTVSAYLLKSTISSTLSRSADYFAQESYKNGSGNVKQIVGYGGAIDTSLNGQFYYGSDRNNYDRLYKYESFRDFSVKFKDDFRKLKVLAKALGHINDSLLAGEDSIGNYYVDGLVTPLNIGVAYLDNDVLNKIFRWNLVSTLMGGQRDMLIVNPSDGGQPYVFYKGFRIYYNSIAVTKIDYKVYNLYNSDDADAFSELTNIDVANYLATSGIYPSDERSRVIVATLNYNIKVGYEGITPIKRVFQWALNTGSSRDDFINTGSSSTSVARNEDSWDTSSSKWSGDTTLSRVGARNEDLSGGGSDFGNAVDINNNIVYYIIR